VQHFDYTNKDINLKKGDEMGRFNMGSTVIMLMPSQDNSLNLSAGQAVRMGESLV
jgi:phosphatidylserine decarboxylase